MPYVSVATQLRVGDPLKVRSPVLIPLDALARHSRLNPDDPLARRLSSFLRPQSKYDIQKFQCRVVAPRNTLKSSLKCSRTRRVISEPSTPPIHSPVLTSISPPPPNPKSVRFKDKDDGELESVCLFRPTGRPSSISHPRSLSDTETETETETALEVSQQRRAVVGATTFTPTEISPIPSPHTPPESNVQLESLTFLPARPPLLRGTIRVRNIAFEKSVAARFTTDDWTTISEAHARYVGPAADSLWDIFAFTIPLGAPRTLLLAVRYAVPDIGEWWDNNGGADFRVVLAPVTQRPAPPVPAVALSFGVGGVGATARPRRAVVGACRANVAPTKTYGYPTIARLEPPVPPETNQ